LTATALALIGYAAWCLLLVAVIAGLRTGAVLMGRSEGNTFAVDGSDLSPFAQRLARTHANCYESLPVFAAIALTALVTGQHAVTDPMAIWVLVARVGQSIVHLASTSGPAINVRFGFFLVQLFIQVSWVVALLRAAT
jgi:uncharacterized MAPEG superfamily protein